MSELIEIEVYRYSAPSTMVDVLNGRISPTFLEEMKGPGGINVTIPMSDPKIIEDPTLLDYRNILKVRVNGVYVGAGVIQKKTTILVDGDPANEAYQISGEGLRTWLKDAVVYPEGGLRKGSYDTRAFNFASARGSWYHSGDWETASTVYAYGDVVGSPWRYAPANWPDAPLAKWVWNSTSITSPAGDNFFRYEFTAAVAAKYSFFFAASDQFMAYIDGQLQAQSDPDTVPWSDTARIDVDLEVGPHVFAVKVSNGVDGPAGFLGAAFIYGDPDAPTSAQLVSVTGSADWLVNGYPTQPPGWSVGEIMGTLLDEAEARSVLFPSWITQTFTDTEDSYGNAWDTSLDWSFDVGSSLDDVVEKLEELACDVWINPDTYEFNIVQERGIDRSEYGYAVDGITVIRPVLTFEKGKNLLGSSIDGVSEIANSLLMKTTDGWLTATDTSSISLYGTVEAELDTNVSSSLSGAVAQAVFLQKGTPEEGASYSIVTGPDYMPWVDFFPGDYVLAPDSLGNLVKRRVMSISVEEDTAGNPQYAVEFDTIFQDNDTKFSRWMSRMSGGLGSTVANSGGGASPIGQPVLTPPGQPVIKLPLPPTNVAAESIGLWSTDGVAAYSEVTVTWDAVTGNTDGSSTVPLFYEVWGHLTSASDGTYERFATTSDTTATFRPFLTGSEWTFHVRAANTATAFGAYSDPIDITMAAPTTPMAAPSAPTLSSNKGVLIVHWDGELTGSVPPPPQFRYVYVTIATSSGGTYTQMGGVLTKSGDIYISDLTVGTAYWAKLIAVDGLGIVSPASSSGTATLTGTDLGDLDSSVTDAIDAANQAALEARGTIELLNDSSFETTDGSNWTLLDSDTTQVTTSPRSGSHSVDLKAKSASYTGIMYAHHVEVTDGETYYLNGWVRMVSGTGVDSGIVFVVLSGPTLATMTTTNTSEVSFTQDGLDTTYVNFGGAWAVPTGDRFATVAITVEDTGNTNHYLVDDLSFRFQVPETQIADNAISADKLQAASVVAGKLDANSVAALNIQAGAVVAGKIEAGSVTTNEIAAGTITGDDISAGTITVTNLRGDVGSALNITDNESINLVVGQISTVNDAQNATDDNLAVMQTYYSFGPDGAEISNPGSPYSLLLKSNEIDIELAGTVVSWWDADGMHVPSFIGTKVILGNHQLEQYGTGTVVRTL